MNITTVPEKPDEMTNSSCSAHKLPAIVNRGVASYLRDLDAPQPEAKSSPSPIRAIARLALIVIIVVLLVLAVLVIAILRPKLKVSTYTGKVMEEDLLTKRDSPAEGSVQGADEIDVCPCVANTVSWSDFTQFYIIKAKPNPGDRPSNYVNITSQQRFHDPIFGGCADQQTKVAECDLVFGSTFDVYVDAAGTYIASPNVLTYPDLYTTVVRQMSYNLYNAVNQLFLFINSNYTSDAIIIGALLRFAAVQFLETNTSSTPLDFWEAANKSVWTSADLISSGIISNSTVPRSQAFGLTVSWEGYIDQCDPHFCNKFVPVSLTYNVVAAIGQVGGVFSVITLAIRFVVWPILIRSALCFP